MTVLTALTILTSGFVSHGTNRGSASPKELPCYIQPSALRARNNDASGYYEYTWIGVIVCYRHKHWLHAGVNLAYKKSIT